MAEKAILRTSGSGAVGTAAELQPEEMLATVFTSSAAPRERRHQGGTCCGDLLEGGPGQLGRRGLRAPRPLLSGTGRRLEGFQLLRRGEHPSALTPHLHFGFEIISSPSSAAQKYIFNGMVN